MQIYFALFCLLTARAYGTIVEATDANSWTRTADLGSNGLSLSYTNSSTVFAGNAAPQLSIDFTLTLNNYDCTYMTTIDSGFGYWAAIGFGNSDMWPTNVVYCSYLYTTVATVPNTAVQCYDGYNPDLSATPPTPTTTGVTQPYAAQQTASFVQLNPGTNTMTTSAATPPVSTCSMSVTFTKIMTPTVVQDPVPAATLTFGDNNVIYAYGQIVGDAQVYHAIGGPTGTVKTAGTMVISMNAVSIVSSVLVLAVAMVTLMF
jgi:hypothetical protein